MTREQHLRNQGSMRAGRAWPGRPGPAARSGFSMMELLVVITIIIIVVGLLVNMGIERIGPQKLTEEILQVAKGAAAEYQASTNGVVVDHRFIAWDPNNSNPSIAINNVRDTRYPGTVPFMDGAVPRLNTIERFVYKVDQYPDARKMLESLGDTVYRDWDGDGFLDIVDAWDRPLRYATRVNYEDVTTTEDFVLTSVHPEYVEDDPNALMPESAQWYFASSGRDGKWGDINSTIADVRAAAKDNIYSFNLD